MIAGPRRDGGLPLGAGLVAQLWQVARGRNGKPPLSLGERVDRDGAVTSRRGPGEGSRSSPGVLLCTAEPSPCFHGPAVCISRARNSWRSRTGTQMRQDLYWPVNGWVAISTASSIHWH